MITPKQPVKAAIVNAAFVSRIDDTSALGKVDLQNTTQSTVPNDGALKVAGGVGIAKNLNVGGNAIITGDLSVLGNSTVLNTAVMDVEDINITVNKGGSDITSEGSGLTVDRVGTKGSIIYGNALASKWAVGSVGAESEVITAAFAQTLSALKTFSAGIIDTGTFSGDIVTDSVTSGANQVLGFPSKMILKVTNAGLVSISGIGAPAGSNIFFLINGTGVDLIIKNQDAIATDILTGTGSDFTFKINAICLFVRDTSSNRWRLVGGGGGGSGSNSYQEKPSGTPNGVLTTFGLSFTPTSADALLVLVDGIARTKTSEWGLSGSNIVFTAGNIPTTDQTVYAFYSTSATAPSLSPATEFRTISAGEVTAKKIVLTGTPTTPSVVLVDHIGGTSQEFSIDYTIVGNELRWNGYALDGVIVAGYKLRVHYFV